MKTEEYIIILAGVVAENNEITITYSSDSLQSNVAVQIIYSNGKVVKTFDHVKRATNGVLTFPTDGLFPGSYTCTISENGEQRDSKTFLLR